MQIINREIQYENIAIRYEIHIRKVKGTILKIERDGKLVAVTNAREPLRNVDAFVYQKLDWIIKNQRKAMHKQSMLYEDVMSDDYFYLFGKQLTISRIYSSKNYVRYDDTTFYVYYTDEKKAHQSVINFIKKTCEQEFLPVVEYYYDKLKDYRFPYPQVRFRSMSSRWGSCIPRKQVITLNTRMIHYPREFMEYVVLHELVHFVQPNHSKAFYQIIEFHMCDYKKRKKLVETAV